jgi:hypothetical protein
MILTDGYASDSGSMLKKCPLKWSNGERGKGMTGHYGLGARRFL